MAIEQINLGTEPLGTGGDTARAALHKVNANFGELDTRVDATANAAAGAQAGADASLKKTANLGDLQNAEAARGNLGLGAVENYPVATSSQALDGNGSAYMTPQRVHEAFKQFGLGTTISVPASNDCNDIPNETRFYDVTNDTANLPDGDFGNRWGALLNFTRITDRHFQLYGRIGGGGGGEPMLYMRNRNGRTGGWSNWYEMLHTGNLDPSTKADTTRTITAGNGLSGGGTLAANRTITLGNPGTLSGSTTNAVQSTSHTHALSANLKAWDSIGLESLGGYRNKLINGDFRVNQRGFNGNWTGLANGVYGYDRWKRSGSNIQQVIEAGNFRPSTVHTLSGTDVTTQQITSPASGNWTITVPNTARNIQLEEGSTVTPFEQRHIQQELALCQRYGALVRVNARFHATAAGQRNNTSVYPPVHLRTNPTISLSFTGAQSNVQSAALTDFNEYGGRLEIISNGAGDAYMVRADCWLDAEI